MTMTERPKLRWNQYSLSLLFIMATLVALACSWYINEMHKATKRRAVIEEIIELGGSVKYYDYTEPDYGGEPPRWFSWLRKLHGDEYLGNAVYVNLGFTQVTDAGLLYLKDLPKLERLVLDDTQITDAGLVHLMGLTKLKELVLTDTQITDAGLVYLKDLSKLETLGFVYKHIKRSTIVGIDG